ncbi:MAG: DoxX family membrane protein [Bacteroidales bacterium]|nr:DoxX family membrane protein [Bacteroidales bacterium]MCL2738638.1 DoxX family membrane protein [Bacteroidales bacterium]
MNYSTKQLTALVILRVFIGWHFAYEGIVKIFSPSWGAAMYLRDSQGFLSRFFIDLADSSLMPVVDFLNEWGLLLIGLGLICGAFAKMASICGIILLSFYYMSHPSFLGVQYAMPVEGNYLWIDKNVVEMAALAVVFFFPTSQIIGLDRFIKKYLPKFV